MAISPTDSNPQPNGSTAVTCSEVPEERRSQVDTIVEDRFPKVREIPKSMGTSAQFMVGGLTATSGFVTSKLPTTIGKPAPKHNTTRDSLIRDSKGTRDAPSSTLTESKESDVKLKEPREKEPRKRDKAERVKDSKYEGRDDVVAQRREKKEKKDRREGRDRGDRDHEEKLLGEKDRDLDNDKEKRSKEPGNNPRTATSTVAPTSAQNREQSLSWTMDDIIPRLVAPFMSFQEVLNVRRCSRTMYFGRRFRLVNVDITPFAFIGQSAVWHYVLPLAIRTCTPGALQKMSFRGCTMLSDTFYNALFSDATILPQTLLSVTVENQVPEAAPPSINGSVSPLANDDMMDSKATQYEGLHSEPNPKSPDVLLKHEVQNEHETGEQILDSQTEVHEPLIPLPVPIKMLHCSLKTLQLDFCPQVTDKTLDLLLSIHFPRLEKLSFQCVRSNMLTGEPFIRLLDKNMWPRFHELDSSFTHMTLQALDLASSFALARALDIGTTPKIKIAGSLASVAFFKVLGLDQVHESFRKMIELGDLEALEKTVKYFEQAYSTQVDSPGLKRMILCRLLRHQSLELLMNAPLTTAVAAEKLRKHDLVNKAKLMAASENEREAAIVGDALAANVKDPSLGVPLDASNCGVESQSPTDPPREDKKAATDCKELSLSVTRWTYPIYTAVRYGHRRIVEHLLKSGVVFNIVDYDGSTPLHVATTYACQASESSLSGGGEEMLGNLLNGEGDEDEIQRRSNIVKLLLSWDCNVNALDVNSRRWPINAAAKYDNAALVGILIEAGARVNFPGHIVGNLTGESGPKGPLLVACEADPVSTRAIKALVSARADVIGMSSKGRYTGGASPILTVYRRARHLLELFLGAISPEKIRDKDKVVFDVLSELLSTAITKADIATVTLLCRDIPELLQREHSIWSYPIHQAAKLQDPSVLEFILEQYTVHGWVRYFTEPDSSGRTPLMVAAFDNSLLGVEALLEKDVDVDRTDHNGNTALMMTCENNLWGVAALLIKAGSDINIQSSDEGYTALMLSIISRQERVALKLIEHCKEHCLDVDIQDFEGRSALMLACFFGMFRVAAELMALNCDVGLVDSNGNTAEMILKKKIDATNSGTGGSIRSSMARKFGKLSRIGRDRSISSRVSRKGTEKWDEGGELTDVLPSTSEKALRTNDSFAASELIRFDASNVSISEGEKGASLQDEEMMRDLQERAKKAAQKLLKQIKEHARDQEQNPQQKPTSSMASPKVSSVSSKSSISSRFSRSGSVMGDR